MDHYYDTIAPSYDELYYEEQKAKLDLIDEEMRKHHLVIHPTSRLLDIGCGTGISTEHFMDRCLCVGVDPSKGLLDRARKGPDYQLAYAEDLPFDDGSFDIIISLTSIQNFKDLDKATEEMRRVVSKGFMVISFLRKAPNRPQIEKSLDKFEKITVVKESKDIIYFLKI